MARAFGDELAPNAELQKVVKIFLQKTKMNNIDEAVDKFINIPKTSKLVWASAKPPRFEDFQNLTAFPSVQIKNVIAFPGVPRFFEQSFKLLEVCFISNWVL